MWAIHLYFVQFSEGSNRINTYVESAVWLSWHLVRVCPCGTFCLNGNLTRDNIIFGGIWNLVH